MQIKEFDFSVNLLRVLLWQYNNAPNLTQWVQNKQNFMNVNHSDFWDDWYADVFNIDTATEFGISVWAIILEVPLLTNLTPVDPDRESFGFGSLRKNFTNGNFAPAASSASQLLTIEQRRLAIKMRYQQLTSNGTIPNINQILKNIFGAEGLAYVRRTGVQEIEYAFTFAIPEWIEFFFTTLLLFPTPACFQDSLVEV